MGMAIVSCPLDWNVVKAELTTPMDPDALVMIRCMFGALTMSMTLMTIQSSAHDIQPKRPRHFVTNWHLLLQAGGQIVFLFFVLLSSSLSGWSICTE
jgi:hypothetical protein